MPANYTLAETIDNQRAASLAHRLRLGLGEYQPINGTEVLSFVPVEWRDDRGVLQKDGCAVVHVFNSMACLYVNGNNGRGIVRRLGCPGLKIDGK
jgi:hypothetical protein